MGFELEMAIVDIQLCLKVYIPPDIFPLNAIVTSGAKYTVLEIKMHQNCQSMMLIQGLELKICL